MRILFKSIIILVLTLVLLLVLASQLISTQDILNQVNNKVAQATGRTLIVDGKQNLRVFPSLLLELENVHLSNMQAGSSANMANISELVIHIPWLSVFSGELNIDKFVINNPDILLEKSIDGTANWQFTPKAKNTADAPSASSANTDPTPPKTTTLPAAFDISLGQVEINGGKLTFIDHQTQHTKVIDQLSLAILLPSLRQPLSLSGSVRYMAQVFELEASITTPAKAIDNQAFSLALALTSDLVKLHYQGEVLNQGQELNGSVSVSGDSVKQLVNWQNIALVAKDNAFNDFSLMTNMRFADNTLILNDLQVKLDALAFKGSSEIILSTPLQVNGELDLGILDLNPYLPAPSAAQPPVNKTENTPLVWDDTQLDLSVLGQLNANLTVQSQQLLVRKIKLGENKLAINLKNAIANVQLQTFKGYDGEGHGTFNVKANTKPYQISSDFQLTNMNAAPLLNDALGFDKLLGKGNLAWQISTKGISQRDFIEQLNGDISINFIDGAIKGFNLAAIAKSANNVMTGNFAAVNLDKDFSHADKTDFAAFTGDFTLKNGVANTENLALNNPFIRVSGKGDIDLPNTKLALQIKTKLVASAQGQTATEANSGVEIPIKITGPFHQIKIRPDVSSGTKDKLKDKVKDKLTDKLKGLFR